MPGILKILLVFLGGLLIGFGLGMVAAISVVSTQMQYWVIIVVSLILGGFLMALGLTKKEKKRVKEEKEKKEEKKDKEEKEETEIK